MRLGLVPSLLYLTLNKGYQKRSNGKRLLGVQHNTSGMPVDFDVTKYIRPFKKGESYSKVQEEELAEIH